MLLRPRQQQLVKRAVLALSSQNNTLAVAPTGAGKTIMLSAIVGEMFSRSPQKTCIIAHRDELTAQNQDKFKKVNPQLSTGIFDAIRKSWTADVTFGMIQTLARPYGLSTLPKLDLLVIDEAHHSRAESYQKVISQARELNPQLKLLGMTATPNRGDKKGLGTIFTNVCDQITVSELVASGHLVKPRTFIMDIGTQGRLGKVKKTLNDYDMDEVAQIMNTRPLNEAVVSHWKQFAHNRSTVVFCSTVAHAQHVCKSFQQAGIKSACIEGEMPKEERRVILSAYQKGKIQVLVNVAVLTEGWDAPITSCVVLLRPSSYKATLIQMIGRGLRTLPLTSRQIKNDCLVLDFGTATLTHGRLEQDVKLEDQLTGDLIEQPFKNCPECFGQVPPAVYECPLCGWVFERKDKDVRILRTQDFVLMEIDTMVSTSPFYWFDPTGQEKTMMAVGFKACGVILNHHNQWYGVGWKVQPKTGAILGEDYDPQLLAVGGKEVCMAAASDFINLHEDSGSAYKEKKWLLELATEAQKNALRKMNFTLSRFADDPELTKIKASALMALTYHHRQIKALLKTFDQNTSSLQEVA
ncbi:ATP-dependent RNA helicase SrmB [Caedimonas varicaedens]|uniref:ATP-dependent RNA helicase SrmB n=1 Tax=Caedimonas varicaedens TaxID=1629334 RepID=A0A0K8MFL1_9PROT|nr:ATP-dependent RNA helicase SrmB [Caedimonas varicaedens]